MSGAAVVLADIERLCWQLSGWRVEPRDVSRLLTAVEAYARGEEFFAEGGTVTLSGSGPVLEPQAVPEDAPEAPAQPLTGSETHAAAPEAPEPVSEAQTGVQRVVHSGEITLRILAGPRPAAREAGEPEPVHERAPEPVAPEPEPQRPPPPSDPRAPRRTCRRCEYTQPLDQFHRDVKALEGRKLVCRLCENKRKRESKAAKRAALKGA